MSTFVIASRQAAAKTIPARKHLFSQSAQWYFFTLAVSCAYLYFDLFASLRIPFLLGGDQVYYWTGAQRLLSGQTIYRDFFQYTPPGTDLVYEVWFKIFGDQIWVTNAVVLTLGVLSACLCFSISRQLMKNSFAFIAMSVFLVVIYGTFLNSTNHWFAVFFILLAVRVSMEQLTAGSTVLSGALLAVATFFNQAHGVVALAAFIVFLVLSGTRKNDGRMNIVRAIFILILTFALATLCINSYYLSNVGFARLWFCLVTSVLRFAGQSSRTLGYLGLPSGLSRLRMLPYLSVYLLLPLVYGFAFWKCWRSRRELLFPWNPVMLLSLIGSFLLIEVGVSVNALRVFAIAMPGIILLMWVVGRLRLPSPALFIGVSIALVAVGLHQIVEKHRICSSRVDLPGGRFAATPQTYDKLTWLAQHTQPGNLFLQAGWPGVYLPLKVQSPLYMPTLTQWDCFYEENIKSAIQQLDAVQVHYVLWTRTLDRRCEFSSCNDYLLQFRLHLAAYFQPVRTFSDGDTLWERKRVTKHNGDEAINRSGKPAVPVS